MNLFLFFLISFVICFIFFLIFGRLAKQNDYDDHFAPTSLAFGVATFILFICTLSCGGTYFAHIDDAKKVINAAQ